MALTNSRIAYMNRSSTNIPVYSSLVHSMAHTGGVTVGGNELGKIYPDECYTVIPNDSYYITSFEIIFRDKNGNEARGFIETSPGFSLDDYGWVRYQEPYHYYNSNGTKLISAQTTTLDGKTQYLFTVKKAVSYRNRSGTNQGTLAVGTQLATDTSATGQTYGSHMVFNKKNTGSGWVNLCSDGYGFVNLGFSVGSKATNRAIY